METFTPSTTDPNRMVTPVFTQRVALPQEIRIPVNVAQVVGSPRSVFLRHGMQLAAGIAEFMMNDPRYKAWFASNPLAESEKALETPVVVTEGVSVQEQVTPVENPDTVVSTPVEEPAVIVNVEAGVVAEEPVIEDVSSRPNKRRKA